MFCTERQRLVRMYQTAVRAYHEAVAVLEADASIAAWHHAESARTAADVARDVVFEHQRDHACAAAFQKCAAKHAEVNLFSVDRERWEPFAIAVCGEPPHGALAYERASGAGRWIVDLQELDRSQRQNADLHFTEAGLNVLRNDGLEM